MKKTRRQLTLAQPMIYQIKVPGQLDESWLEWGEHLTLTVEHQVKEQPITIITGRVDQATLHGLLRRLYSLGLPLISVICLGE